MDGLPTLVWVAIALAALLDAECDNTEAYTTALICMTMSISNWVANRMIPDSSRASVTYGSGDASDLYAKHVGNPTLFKALTNFTPDQFETLMQILLDPSRPESYLLKPRDVKGRRGLRRQRRTRGGRPHKLDPRTRVFLCLVRLKDDDRLVRMCADSGLNVCSLCDDFWHVCECLLVVTQDCILWPSSADRAALQQTMVDLAPAPGTLLPIGVVDGTAQYVRRPGADEPLYYNGRKKRHFLNHLVVCDWRGRIMAAFVGYNGRTHDSIAYRTCPLHTRRREFFSQGQTLLADNGFQGCDLLTPVTRRGSGPSERERMYNKLVRRYRVVIEFLFGAMKSKFGIIAGTWRHNLARADMVFMLCCQLMNFYMDVNGKTVRGRAFRNRLDMEEWEQVAFGQCNGNWQALDDGELRALFSTPAMQRIYEQF